MNWATIDYIRRPHKDRLAGTSVQTIALSATYVALQRQEILWPFRDKTLQCWVEVISRFSIIFSALRSNLD
jgi:hypothetical protein